MPAKLTSEQNARLLFVASRESRRQAKRFMRLAGGAGTAPELDAAIATARKDEVAAGLLESLLSAPVQPEEKTPKAATVKPKIQADEVIASIIKTGTEYTEFCDERGWRVVKGNYRDYVCGGGSDLPESPDDFHFAFTRGAFTRLTEEQVAACEAATFDPLDMIQKGDWYIISWPAGSFFCQRSDGAEGIFKTLEEANEFMAESA